MNRRHMIFTLPLLAGILLFCSPALRSAADQTYEKALQKFPGSFELLKAAGRLNASLNRFEEAIPLLAEVHDRNTSDTEISYYLGIAYEGLEREEEAADVYGEALRLPAFRAAAAVRLAELQARAGKLEQAKELLTLSLQSAPEDLRAVEELAAVHKALGETKEAETLARERLARFPLSISATVFPVLSAINLFLILPIVAWLLLPHQSVPPATRRVPGRAGRRWWCRRGWRPSL